MKSVLKALLLICLCLSDGVNAEPLTDVELVLAGLYVNGLDEGPVDTYRRDGEYWLSLADLEYFTGLRGVKENDHLLLNTPIGVASLALSQLAELDGQFYLSSAQLLQLLQIRLVFNQPRYALVLAVPWQPGDALQGEAAEVDKPAERSAEILAPNTSLGFLRWRTDYSRLMDTDRNTWVNTLDTGGAVGEGTWLLGLRDQDNDKARVERYFWNRVFEHSVIRLGTNYIDLGLLLNNYDYTGAQWAWSNSGINKFVDFETDLNFDSFLREDVEVQRDIIRNDGPPGGIAELRLDGRPLFRVRVSLTGHYEFRNIPIRQGTFQTTEVFLYQHSLNDNPAVVNLTRSTIRQMLNAGEWLLRSGLGEGGNSLYNDYGSPNDGDAVGFFLMRYGIADTLTFQAVIQDGKEDEKEVMAGLRMSLGQSWALAFDVADRSGNFGMTSELIGWGQNWDLQFRSQYYAENYRNSSDNSEYDHYLRGFYAVFEDLRLGVVARKFRDYRQREIEFIKPGVYWNPYSNVALSAVPNTDGNYRLRGDWYISPYSRSSATYENDQYNISYTYQFSSAVFSESGFDYDSIFDDHRIYSRVSWYVDDNQYNYFQSGVSYNSDSVGWYVSWNRIFTPGIELLLQYQNGYRSFSRDVAEPQLQVGLRIDLASSGRRLVPTDNRRVNFTRGGISGFIRNEDGTRINAEDVDIRVNGRVLPQYQAGGAFTVGNLRPGVYSVEIDEGKLPIEYVPRQHRYSVEVARSTITEVEFVVQEEYGVAGKVVDGNGLIVTNAKVVAIDDQGKVSASSTSGSFGYYRMDSLVPRRYVIRVIEVNGVLLQEPLTEIIAIVEDDFLFNQDIQFKD